MVGQRGHLLLVLSSIPQYSRLFAFLIFSSHIFILSMCWPCSWGWPAASSDRPAPQHPDHPAKTDIFWTRFPGKPSVLKQLVGYTCDMSCVWPFVSLISCWCMQKGCTSQMWSMVQSLDWTLLGFVDGPMTTSRLLLIKDWRRFCISEHIVEKQGWSLSLDLAVGITEKATEGLSRPSGSWAQDWLSWCYLMTLS